MYEEKSGTVPLVFVKTEQTPRAKELGLNLDINETATLMRLTEDLPNAIYSTCDIYNQEIFYYPKIVLLGTEATKYFFKKPLKDCKNQIFSRQEISQLVGCYILCLPSLSRLYMSNLKKEKELLRQLCDL